MFNKSFLSIFQLAFCVIMLSSSFLFEYVLNLSPCLLCLVQRVIVSILLLLAIFTLIRVVKGMRVWVFRGISIIVSLLGVLVAWRHVWLQQNAVFFDSVSCLPDIHYMLKVMSLSQVITHIISNVGSECTEVKWTFIGYSMPFWVGVMYFFYMTSQIISLFHERNNLIKR